MTLSATDQERPRANVIFGTGRFAFLLVLPFLLGRAATAQESKPKAADKGKRERLLEIYRTEAAGYTIYRDSKAKEKVELKREPVYVWTNPVRGNGQDGAVFVWTCRGRRRCWARSSPTRRRARGTSTTSCIRSPSRSST